jgi:hypothetical protein
LTPPASGSTIAAVRIWLSLFAGSIVAVAACGARTGLPVPVEDTDAGMGGSFPEKDAGHDAHDAHDAGPDVFDVFDASDAPPDVFDAPPDAPPDVVILDNCQDGGTTYIYVIGVDNRLYSFYPPTGTHTYIGTIACPSTSNPYSMAVDRQGTAYVVFNDGELFKVNTANASCEATTFQTGQGGFPPRFGMGFSANTFDPGEKLYVAGADTMTPILGTIDTTSFITTTIGPVSSPIGEAELTGSGSGDLYAFGIVLDSTTNMVTALHLSQLDKLTANVIGDAFVTLSSGTAQITDWAFAYWGGDFYFFTSAGQPTTIVSRYTPGGTTDLPVYATIPSPIVGAGVSTCAPHP